MVTDKLKARFFSKVLIVPKITAAGNYCVEWQGAKRGSYGVMQMPDRLVQATHVSWLIKHGTWPGQQILHRCDNPPCVLIGHLFEGTNADNVADRVAKGRGWSRLSQVEVDELRRLADTRMPIEEIAEKFNVGVSYVSALRHGHYRGGGTAKRKPHQCETVVVDGQELTLKEIAGLTNLPLGSIYNRYRRGLRGADLLAPAYQTRRKPYTRRT